MCASVKATGATVGPHRRVLHTHMLKMTAPSRPWEINDGTRTRRVRYHKIQAALWAPTLEEEDACLEALMDQQDREDSVATRSWSRSARRGGIRYSRGHPGGRTGTISTNTRQSRAKQLEAGTTVRRPSNEIPAAIRFWWCRVLTSRNKRVDPRLHAFEKQISSQHDNRHQTVESCVMQAGSGPRKVR